MTDTCDADLTARIVGDFEQHVEPHFRPGGRRTAGYLAAQALVERYGEERVQEAMKVVAVQLKLGNH